jgi:two-component sensor histidine kinase
VCWREINGPRIASSEPDRKGFGSRLIVSSLQAFGEASVSYQQEGFVLLAALPLAKIQLQNDLSAIETAPKA